MSHWLIAPETSRLATSCCRKVSLQSATGTFHLRPSDPKSDVRQLADYGCASVIISRAYRLDYCYLCYANWVVKILDGKELASYIKERQAKQVRSLVQARKIQPSLAIVKTKDEPVINTYVRLKMRYGNEIGVNVEIIDTPQSKVLGKIKELNEDSSVHGIIVQLPLEDSSQSEEILNAVALEKDVDGLAQGTSFDPATPTAIMWLLAGYNIDLRGKKFIVIGKGLLVGAPLIKILETSGHNVASADSRTENIEQLVQESDIVVSATGQAGLITSEMITPQTVIIDAGVAVQSGKTVGDITPDLYDREDIAAITPQKGGVGPLTVSALFENVLKAAGATGTA